LRSSIDGVLAVPVPDGFEHPVARPMSATATRIVTLERGSKEGCDIVIGEGPREADGSIGRAHGCTV
jgi:hypothetical protein